jgi:tetratricopeptide (TPR) repeat protein
MWTVMVALCISGAPTFDASELLVAGEQYVQNGQGKKAVPVLQKAIAAGTLKPEEHARALTAMGVAKGQLGDNDAAVKLFEEAIAKNPADEKPYLMLGMTYDITERFQEARGAYQRGVDKFPKSAPLLRELGATELLLGDSVHAAEHLGAALKKLDDDADLMRDYGQALLATGKAADAVKVLQDARQLDSDNAQIAFTLGDALAATGKSADAVSLYDEALKIDGNHAPAHFHKGLILSKQGDIAGAVASYRKALKLDPNLTRARLALGVALTHADGKEDEAIALFKSVVEKDPSFAEAHAQLGLLLEKKGDLPGAEEALQNAVNRREGDARLWKDLARVQEKRGKKKDAAASTKNAQKFDRGNTQ